MTHHQQNTIDALATTHGGVMVREGYTDGNVRVTLPNLRSGIVSEAGRFIQSKIDTTADAIAWAASQDTQPEVRTT